MLANVHRILTAHIRTDALVSHSEFLFGDETRCLLTGQFCLLSTVGQRRRLNLRVIPSAERGIFIPISQMECRLPRGR